MKSKDLDNKIIHLNNQIQFIKWEVNSGQYSICEFRQMINDRINMKKELSHLLKLQKLIIERKLKIDKINGI